MPYRLRSGRIVRLPFVLAFLGCSPWLAAACGSGTSIDANPSSTSPPPLGSTGSDETHEPPSDCAEPPGCDVEELCAITTCGGKTAALDHFGCARTLCEADADCPTGEACYPRAMGASCLASDESCDDAEAGMCLCAVTQDCGGILSAHCLPTEFYPVETYCEIEAFQCDAMPDWHGALRAALAFHEAGGRVELTQRLSECSVSLVDARVGCGELPCSLLCGLSTCDGIDDNACTEACEAGGLDPAELQALTVALAAEGTPTCVCDVCEAGAPCEATWGC